MPLGWSQQQSSRGSTVLRSVLASLLFLATASQADADAINLLIWERYIDGALLDEWTARTGVEVRQIVYDSGDARDELLANPANDIDLVVVNENSAKIFGRSGILEPLDKARVPALPQYAPKDLDRCFGTGIPYLYGTMGILYRPDKVAEAPSSWRDILEPAPALAGHIAMFDDTTETFVAPLILLGESINTQDDAVLRRAYELLKAQAPSVLTYDYVMTSIYDPAYGEKIWMALGYSGDQHALNRALAVDDQWRYVLPNEGSMFWMDCLSVVSASRKKALALDLLDHLSGEESALRNSQTLRMPTSNQAALVRVPPELRNDPEIYPPPSILDRSQIQDEVTAESAQRRRRIINALANFRDAR